MIVLSVREGQEVHLLRPYRGLLVPALQAVFFMRVKCVSFIIRCCSLNTSIFIQVLCNFLFLHFIIIIRLQNSSYKVHVLSGLMELAELRACQQMHLEAVIRVSQQPPSLWFYVRNPV
jgi:hypothetical protein